MLFDIMERTTIYIEKKDLAFIRKQGYTLTGFVRAIISELKEKKTGSSLKRTKDHPIDKKERSN